MGRDPVAVTGPAFWLGVHHPHWLRAAGVPLFVSARRLRDYRTPPRAAAPWALDSGGFTELSLYGGWRTTPESYTAEVVRWRSEVGSPLFASPQDWMCEPFMLAKTGLTVAGHQRLTTENYLTLRRLAPSVPWLPVLQGWAHQDYLAHLEAYRRSGVDLAALPLVGLGSVCRRQGTAWAEALCRDLAGAGLRLHAFGFKLSGLLRCGRYLASSDSMAWSFEARRLASQARRSGAPWDGCPTGRHRGMTAGCANCLPYALAWRERALRAGRRAAARPEQRLLFGPRAALEG